MARLGRPPKRECECGAPATVKVQHTRICTRCAELQSSASSFAMRDSVTHPRHRLFFSKYLDEYNHDPRLE